MSSLERKSVIITGATKGIGRGIAEAMAGQGANVAVVSRHLDDCLKVAEELNSKYGVLSVGISADVTKRKQVETMTEQTLEKFGSIDILVNNAGTAITKRAEDLTDEDWNRVIDLDLNSVFICSQTVGRQMIKQKSGKIINISSVFGLVADKQVLPYLVAKGGVLQMTKGLALEWAKYNIQVNAICPGYIETEINRDALSQEKIRDGLLKKTAVRRFGQVEDVASTAVFLASDASDYMTGSHILIDGGWCAQ